MNHLFVTYEIALKLKELGFNEPCVTTFFKKELVAMNHRIGNLYFDKLNSEMVDSYTLKHHSCNAPMHQQVTDWLREKHNINIISPTLLMYSNNWICRAISLDTKEEINIGGSGENYYDALNRAIEEVLIKKFI